MDHYQNIAARFQQTIENIAMSVDQLAEPIAQASELMTQVLLHDGRLFSAGNGVDAVISQLLVTSLIGRLDQERPALPAFNLCADGAGITAVLSDEGPADIFSRPLRALAQEGDLLLALHSGGDPAAVVAAVEAAHDRGMLVVAITCDDGAALSSVLQTGDANIAINAARRSQRVELQTIVVQCLCELIEQNLFGNYQEN
ncbi:D-sedoheptulose-7-phosphate isomerase [Pseudohalioglobus lutimaris]|uniref:SIS domain-containing protein n=1 Tax=Pseudohalioglobus lutimaris TaxID=1737061 RepID=A0A2N5X7B7_9GAMM|nr:SIS domain-containing protein [Pseudohalioglobus lutimaris]PLW70384.1 SIS domain-containing protein [Pseudohalioglobus lutimaris]